MFTLQEKIQSVKTQFLQNTPFFSKEEFVELFAILRPQYDLDDESAGKIFEATDKLNEGKIPRDEVERILDAVMESEDQNDMSNSSIVVDKKVSVLLKSGKPSIASPKKGEARGSTQVSDVPIHFLTNLDLNKITEIKHIFSICEKKKGYVTIDQIKEFMNDVKQFSCPPEELMEIFNSMKDENTNKITSNTFYNRITEAEKAILGVYMSGQDYEERSRMGTQSFMIDDAASEYFPGEHNQSVLEQEDFVMDKSEHIFTQNLDQEFHWIIQKIKSVVDEAHRSARQMDMIPILNEIVNLSPQLEKKLKSNDLVYQESSEKWTDQNKMEDFLRMRIANLELESKQQKEFLLNLQNENENLCLTIGELESKINLDQQTQKDLVEKNNEIVRLERNVREKESEKDELKEHIKSLERENQTLTENYKEIQALLKNMDKDMETEEDKMNGSVRAKNLLELDSLQLELRTALNKIEEMEKEKINMKDINNELKDQLSNSKEFIDTLRLEKNDLQSRLDKLQKELEALRSENFGKASAFLQSSKRVSSMKDSLSRAMGVFNSTPLRVSHRVQDQGLRQINEEEEENTGIPLANSLLIGKKSIPPISNLADSNQFMTAPSILKSKNRGQNFIEVMEESKFIKKPSEQNIPVQTMDLMNDVPLSESPVGVMKQPETKEEEENDDNNNLLLEDMSLPRSRPSTVPKPVLEMSVQTEEQKMESLTQPSSVKPVSVNKEKSDKKMALESVTLVESQVAIQPKPVVASVQINDPQNNRASLQAHLIDLRNLDQDYLDLMNKLPIQELLRNHGELINYGVCFSDYVYRITSKEQRNYRVLLITNQSIYCLHPGRSYQVKRKIPLETISKITMSETSAGLFAIHVPNEYDYVIDTFKRLNLILFLQTLYKVKNLKPFPIIYKKSLSVRNRGQTINKEITQYDKTVLNPNLQSTYKSTKKFGDLYLETKMIFTIWKKYFFVVTNLGLLYYKKEGSQKPVDFIPFVGYQIMDAGEIRDNKFIFKIKFPHSNYVVTLGASSEMEKREWIKAITEAKEAQEAKENKEKSVMSKK